MASDLESPAERGVGLLRYDNPMPPPADLVVVEQRSGAHVVFINGNVFNDESATVVRDALRKLIASHEKPCMVLELSRMKHASSNMLGVLLDASLKVSDRDGKLAATGVSAAIADLFGMMKIDKLVPTLPTLDEAIAAVKVDRIQ